ncbi:hypothetical protein Hanom_Chr01g00048471 [Helianthus anomalus]
MAKEERKKWLNVSHERKFKMPLKYYQRDRNVSLGDIISWGFLPQVNAYAIRRECGNDFAMWGYIKYESLREFRHLKPHYPKRVKRVDPETGVTETILNVKSPE